MQRRYQHHADGDGPFANGVETKGMERTFIMIKPDGVQRGLVGEVISRFESKGYKLVAMRLFHADRERVEEHYAEMRPETFYSGLIKYMLSGPVVGMVWEGTNVISLGRKLIGATMPRNAKMGTIRGDLCITVGRNVCHGSDSRTSAEAEIKLWFPELTKETGGWNRTTDQWIFENRALARRPGHK
uniref:nucleoside-diphosphate kinase n=1 Tax=Trieres chinensis TaxID=1514140 RepID=A0A7S2AB93_TRICV|mmetsp:Transcript_9727/g.20556  ORF Transcript_9727/g.20556 Transcript_9727/m.20556 type:complete len:186 (+) Transcript_9727:32-589(+)